MKKLSALYFIAFLLFAACSKKDCKTAYTIYKPVYKSLSEVRAGIKSEAPEQVLCPGKIYVYGKYIFLNEPGKGIHIFDNSNPSSPVNLAFINIPGSYDLAARNGYLYADSYRDLVVFDITDINHIVTKEFVNNVFQRQDRYLLNASSGNPDSVMVAVDFIPKDTLIDCPTVSGWEDVGSFKTLDGVYFTALPNTGIGGSTARFTIINNYLYAVDYSSLYSFDLSCHISQS